MIAYFALHQLGHGDIMLPVTACEDEEGKAVAAFEAPELVNHARLSIGDESVYYDAVACYNEYGVRVKLFATSRKWLRAGEFVSISAFDN